MLQLHTYIQPLSCLFMHIIIIALYLYCIIHYYTLVRDSLASSPGLLRGEGEGRPGIHCMRMRYIFRIIYRKVSVH